MEGPRHGHGKPFGVEDGQGLGGQLGGISDQLGGIGGKIDNTNQLLAGIKSDTGGLGVKMDNVASAVQGMQGGIDNIASSLNPGVDNSAYAGIVAGIGTYIQERATSLQTAAASKFPFSLISLFSAPTTTADNSTILPVLEFKIGVREDDVMAIDPDPTHLDAATGVPGLVALFRSLFAIMIWAGLAYQIIHDSMHL